MLKCLVDNHTTGSFSNASIDANYFWLVTRKVMMSKSNKDAIVLVEESLFHY